MGQKISKVIQMYKSSLTEKKILREKEKMLRTTIFCYCYNFIKSHPFSVVKILDHAVKIKGGYLDFSHLGELKNIYTTEIYVKKQYKSSITKNHKIKKNIFFDGVPFQGYAAY